MLGLKYLMVITKREYSEQYLDFFRRNEVKGVLSTLCNGTATSLTLNHFGLENTEKIMFETLVAEKQIPELAKGMVLEMNIGAVGNGIAMFIPIDSVGGKSSLKYFTGDIEPEQKEEKKKMESKSVLIITVVDKGNVDLVMDAARSAGASGGTVVKAKGTGAEMAKFFGVSISEEKEMVYIVASREGRDSIMRAIMEKAGRNTDAHGIIFTLPIDSVIGIKAFEEV